MRPGEPSQTAILVCMGRAAAHGTTPVAKFSDPTALAFLPEEARRRVERFRAGASARGLPQFLGGGFFAKRVEMMVVRTVAIDDAVRGAASPQVVILGAGLDGRAWRMPELSNSVVYEVDHPDSQRVKMARATALSQVARDVRFVAVDFTRDDLHAALEAAGHESSQPTTWIWEGVVMYLTVPAIESTLRIIQQRSASGSRIVIAYMQPAATLARLFVSLAVRRLGEPLRSFFTATQIRALLARYSFTVKHDKDLPTLGDALLPPDRPLGRSTRHLRIVTADHTAV